MNDPKVYLDDFHIRTTSVLRLRTRFVQLANALINKGDTAKAVQVLDRCIELTPDNKIPYDYTIIQLASSYYKCNKFDKANELVNKLVDLSNEKLDYYLDQQPKFIGAVNDEILYNFQVLQNLISVSKSFNQEEMSRKIEAMADKQYKLYSSKIGMSQTPGR